MTFVPNPATVIPAKAGIQLDPRLRGGDEGGEGRSVRFAGYAALFGKVDRGGDVILPGAFVETLKRAEPLPLLWQHRPEARIGTVSYAKEDRRGLRVIAAIDPASAKGAEAAARLADGSARGLSFGYRARRASGSRPRILEEIDLVEISLVTVPLQTGARVHLTCQTPAHWRGSGRLSAL